MRMFKDALSKIIFGYSAKNAVITFAVIALET